MAPNTPTRPDLTAAADILRKGGDDLEMAIGANRLKTPADSDLARCLKAATENHGYLEVDTGEHVYEIFVSRVRPPKPAPEAVVRAIAGMRAAAGSWKDVDVEAFKNYLAERRRLRTRPRIRL